jgi:hypothetical protein
LADFRFSCSLFLIPIKIPFFNIIIFLFLIYIIVFIWYNLFKIITKVLFMMCKECKKNPPTAFPLTPCLWDTSEGKLVDLDCIISGKTQKIFNKMCQECQKDRISKAQSARMNPQGDSKTSLQQQGSMIGDSKTSLQQQGSMIGDSKTSLQQQGSMIGDSLGQVTQQVFRGQTKSFQQLQVLNNLQSQQITSEDPFFRSTRRRGPPDDQSGSNKRPNISLPPSPTEQPPQSISSENQFLAPSHSAPSFSSSSISSTTSNHSVTSIKPIQTEREGSPQQIMSEDPFLPSTRRRGLPDDQGGSNKRPNISLPPSPTEQPPQSISSGNQFLAPSHSAPSFSSSSISSTTSNHSVTSIKPIQTKREGTQSSRVSFLQDRAILDAALYSPVATFIRQGEYEHLYSYIESIMSIKEYSSENKYIQNLFILRVLMKQHSAWKDIKEMIPFGMFMNRLGENMIGPNDDLGNEEKNQILQFLCTLEKSLSKVAKEYHLQSKEEENVVNNLRKEIINAKIKNTREILKSKIERATAKDWVSSILADGNRELRKKIIISDQHDTSWSSGRIMLYLLAHEKNTSVLPSAHLEFLQGKKFYLSDYQSGREGYEKIIVDFFDQLIEKELEIRAWMRDCWQLLGSEEIPEDLSEGKDEAACDKLKKLMTC